ncbi:zinc finger BED domain-containing protein 4-like [Cottoperca gobio]|uniref:Zinc finger BED domain-containing protein 4-like n=1 Tax=Cottoperca gobio TaxID=56716 RepID=A0A6J2RXR9_COTGO|nr:zinc finger BED domain-containing protein 4-like [Cottoperca gobio]
MSWVCWMEFCCCVIMDRSRKFSPVWNHFDLLTPNKVKCRLCSTELSYINKSTSSMLRHYRARHGGDEESADTRENTPGHNLWETFDMEVEENKRTSNATADSILEVQRYLAESNLPRKQDPLQYWKSNERAYPHLHELALKCLCSPCSSVPCERVFSKAGELVSKRRNRLGAKTLQKLLLLNKNA